MLGHLILNVANFDQSEVFYDTILYALGRHEERKADETECIIKSYGLKDMNYNLMIRYDKVNVTENFVRNPGLDHLCFWCPSKEQCDELYEMMNSLAVVITRVPARYPDYGESYYAFYFRDPSGIPLEIAYNGGL